MRRVDISTLVSLCVLCAMVSACGWFGGNARPAWIDGSNREYPVDQYLLGVGQGESKPVAAERAYGAVAKIFKAEVSVRSKDSESYLVRGTPGHAKTERSLALDQMTKVSTDKVLENVRILRTWSDPRTGQHYALAGAHRTQTEAALIERMTELDRAVEAEVAESRRTHDKLAKVRNLRRAIKHLILREAYNTDLRVVRSSGQGLHPAYRVPELTAELEQFLAASLVVGVEVFGEQADVTRRAVLEGLIREGLPVTDRKVDALQGVDNGTSGRSPELLVTGAVRLWDVPVPDPRFRYVRWCSEFQIIELDTRRIVGAVSMGGREGHLTSSEAKAKAVRIMQHELTSNLARTLAASIYGETNPPLERSPSACPKTQEPLNFPPSRLHPL